MTMAEPGGRDNRSAQLDEMGVSVSLVQPQPSLRGLPPTVDGTGDGGGGIPAAVTVEFIVSLFERIALEEGWQPGDELRAHAARSVYFALSVGLELVGGLQLVLPDLPDIGTGLPCQQVWPEVANELAGRSDVAHAAVMAVARPWRGALGGMLWPLGIAMWRWCVESNVKEIWLEATPRARRCYERVGWPLVVRGELREHWGEPCYLCSMNVREVAGSLAERAVRSPAYGRILVQACGPK